MPPTWSGFHMLSGRRRQLEACADNCQQTMRHAALRSSPLANLPTALEPSALQPRAL
jgi:hypothetical protein